MACEMIDAQTDGEEVAEYSCDRPDVGVTEDGARVCRECGEAMKVEGFRVDWDAPTDPVQTPGQEGPTDV